MTIALCIIFGLVLLWSIFNKVAMKRLTYIILIVFSFFMLTLLLSLFFPPVSSPERNKIVFKYRVMEVQDSICRLKSILENVTPYKDDFVQCSISDSGTITINYSEMMIKGDSLIDKDLLSPVDLNSLTVIQKHRMIILLQFMKENYLTSFDYYKNTDLILCSYRAITVEYGDNSDDFLREIIHPSKNSFDPNLFRPLDHKADLVLVEYKR